MPMPWLERVPTYKEQMEQLTEKDLSTLGFLGYPLLQTADVIIYDAHFVPVGEDQVPHLELSREVVRRFHNFYGEVLVEPQPLLTTIPRLPGLDNRKMSKSYGNTIDLSDDAETVTRKCGRCTRTRNASAPTFPGTVEGNPVFMYHDAFNPDTRRSRRSQGAVPRRQGRRRRGEDEARQGAERPCSSPCAARRAQLMSSPSTLKEILVEGSRKAQGIAAGDDGAGARRGEASLLVSGGGM